MTRAKDISKIVTDADLSGTLDVTGTVTAEDVTISSSVPILRFTDTDTNETATVQTSNSGHILLDASQGNASGSGGLYVRTQAQTLRALFGSNGDISFYEDTGTTPKLFWDASNESLAVGTTNVFNSKIIASSANGTAYGSNSQLRISSGGVNNNRASIVFSDDALSDGKISYYPAALEADRSFSISARLNEVDFVVKGNGNVGIGTSSPSAPLHVYSSTTATNDSTPALTVETQGHAQVRLNGDGNQWALMALDSAVAGNSFIVYDKNNTAERMRIDSSGNFLVGKTSTAAGVGAELRADGQIVAYRSNNRVAYLDRLGSDGDIVELLKDNSVVGTIGAEGGQAYIVTGDTGLKFAPSVDAIIPVNAGGANRDNAIDLGVSSVRFDDIYATNGTIQTSDQNEKNTITDSDLGIDFIKRLTPKSYIFNGKTRTHYGLIAQDVETVLSDISKPTSGFAGFIKSDISEEQDGSEYRYGLRYTEFVAPLIQAVKEQQATIDALTARITALENGE